MPAVNILSQTNNLLAEEMTKVRECFEKQLHDSLLVKGLAPHIETQLHSLITEMIGQLGIFRGKMLRPTLVLLCGRACGSLNHQHHVIAAVIEMVHLATLVHDDVLDEADSRRGGVTLNALHGNEAAVILGDLMFSHVFQLCSSLDSQTFGRLISGTTNTVCGGELWQLYNRGNHKLTEQSYLDIITCKTASLMALCCHLGAMASRAPEDVCRLFNSFGLNLGIAYQIMDDVTDLVGDENSAGKTLGTDLTLEKITLPCIHFLQNASPDDKKWWDETVKSDPRLTPQQPQEHQELIKRLRQTGSLKYARKLAAEYIKKAEQNLDEARHTLSSEIDQPDNNKAGLRQGIWELLLELTRRIL
ncbi:MAG: polyprenyl synthetase family protein [Sedimentisphaerales bacterium]|nr:polyprenyl synthetase family protein [Sedimentisphaerales bacterium]